MERVAAAISALSLVHVHIIMCYQKNCRNDAYTVWLVSSGAFMLRERLTFRLVGLPPKMLQIGLRK